MTRIPPSHFEAMYRADPDPWRFATSPYERAKYDATVTALAGRRYERGLEVGCAIGVLTLDLAEVCEALLALDAAPTALAQAAARTAALPHVTVQHGVVPEDWPPGSFDLIVLSEVGYYLDAPTLDTLLDLAAASLAPGGDLVAVHWTGPTDYPLTGAAVHQALHAHPDLALITNTRTATYRLDVLTRAAVGDSR